MSKIPTAEEFIASKLQQYARGIGNSGKDRETLEKERLIEFAKLHVEAALKEASENAIIGKKGAFGTYWNNTNMVLDKDSILKAYPLTNIK